MKDNRLIAEFMGLFDEISLDEDSKEKVMKGITEYSKYHTSWDWLMPVVERINDTERYEVCIGNCHCHVTDIENDNYKVRALTLSLQGKTTIEATYLAVVEFINWYNKEHNND
jgi:endonuclease IV